MTGAANPHDVRVDRDVVHTRIPGYRPLALDLYAPVTGARAVCVYAHGGGWRLGSRREGPGPRSPGSARSFTRMAAAGLAVASVDYRLSGEARFPAQLDDVVAAVRWLRTDGPPSVRGLPVVTFGVSAGGQLAGLCALDPELGVAAAALWYAVSDLAALPDDLEAAGHEGDRTAGSREALVLGAPASEVPELAARGAVVDHVRPGAPPFLLVHGDRDHLVPLRQSERLHAALGAVGADSTLDVLPGQDHMLAGIGDADLDALVDRTTDFLLHHAAAGAPAPA